MSADAIADSIMHRKFCIMHNMKMVRAVTLLNPHVIIRILLNLPLNVGYFILCNCQKLLKRNLSQTKFTYTLIECLSTFITQLINLYISMIFQLINDKQNLKRRLDRLLCNHINLFKFLLERYSLNLLSSNYKININVK